MSDFFDNNLPPPGMRPFVPQSARPGALKCESCGIEVYSAADLYVIQDKYVCLKGCFEFWSKIAIENKLPSILG